MADGVFRTRSLGAPASGLPDQYADGVAAKLWELYIGDHTSRTTYYKDFLVNLLKSHKCKYVLDVACGTGIDSILLLESGFEMVSIDASDKMLKYALKTRWNNREDPRYSTWVIEEANWLTLPDDINMPEKVAAQGGFDAVICMGNSFAHLPDFSGMQKDQKLAISNFASFVKPGGLFVIDHRNYDYTVATGLTPDKNIYYNSKYVQDIKTSVLYQNGSPTMVTLDYTMDISEMLGSRDETDTVFAKSGRLSNAKAVNHFRLSYYPHLREKFRELILEAFDGKAEVTVYGDFAPLDEIKDPAFFIHVVEKSEK